MRRFLVLAALSVTAPLPAQTGLTIYNDGRVLVRRTTQAAVGAGVSTHKLAFGLLDPSSLFALDSGVTVVGSAYDASVDEANTMRRAVGQTLKFWTGRGEARDTVTATVVGVDPERFRLPGGQITFQRPGAPLYPADLVLPEPTLTVALRSGQARTSVRLGYFTSGASWNADYAVVLGRGGARVSGQAAIPSQSLRVTDAEVQLLAGSVGRDYSAKEAMQLYARAERAAVADMAPGAPAEQQQIGEAHLYTLPGRISLEPGVTSSVALFEPATAPWERAYVVRGQIPWYGMLPQYGNDENTVPVAVIYTLKRTPKTPFGDLPIPGGTFRIYEADSAGRQQLIGESGAPHIAPGQDLRLPAGSAFDLTAKRVQMSYSQRRDSLRTTAIADYRVTITSAKDSAVTVEVLEERQGDWAILSSSLPAEKVSSTRQRFRVRVPAQGTAVLIYRVRVTW